MTRTAIVNIDGCSEREGWEVARVVDNQLCHWGLYATQEKAEEVAEDIGEEAIVLRLTDGE